MTEVVILAGGKGTRLKSVVYDRPKPMAEINGAPFLCHLMDYWVGQGAKHFILSVGFMKEFVSRYFGNVYKEIPITYVEEEKPLGTGGALIKSITTVSDQEFVLTNGDTLAAINFAEMFKEHNRFSADLTMSVFMQISDMKHGTVAIGRNGEVTRFEEKPKGCSAKWVNGGTYIVTKDLIGDRWPKGKNISFETEMMTEFIEQNRRIYAYQSEAEFIDIGDPDDFLRSGSVVKRINQPV